MFFAWRELPILATCWQILTSVWFCFFFVNKSSLAEEMAQSLRDLSGVPEVLSSIRSKHMVDHNHPWWVLCLCALQDTCRQKAVSIINKSIFLKICSHFSLLLCLSLPLLLPLILSLSCSPTSSHSLYLSLSLKCGFFAACTTACYKRASDALIDGHKPPCGLLWLFLVVNLTVSGMNYNPEMEGSPVIRSGGWREKFLAWILVWRS